MAFLENDTLKTSYNRLRKLSVNLFSSVWPEIRLSKIIGIEQDSNKGTLYYKKDFDGVLEKLPKGWDTSINEL